MDETNDQRPGLPAVLESHRGIVMALREHTPDSIDGYSTTLPDDTPEMKMLILKQMLFADQLAEDMIGQVIGISHILCHPVQATDAETGEQQEIVRTVTIDDDGTSTAYGSWVIMQCLHRLTHPKAFGPLPWIPAKKFRIVQKRTRNKRLCYLLEPVVE